MKTTIETLKDIISIIKYEDVNFINSDSIEVKEISDFTDRHYSGPGSLITFQIESGRYGPKWEDAYMVFDDKKTFVGLKREDYFEDIDKDWWRK